jgi:hypothetical protein
MHWPGIAEEDEWACCYDKKPVGKEDYSKRTISLPNKNKD